MNHFVAGILRIVLLEASVALLILDRVISPESTRWRARRRLAVYIIAALSVLAFTNFGQLRGRGLVHAWEQYHFFLGAKYLPEVGYFDLYRATLLADRESVHVLSEVGRTRDLHDFSLVDVNDALRGAGEVRARFSDVRWREFKDDWAQISRWRVRWSDAVADHGNTGSPVWAVVALPLVELCGSSPAGLTVLACVDLLLMLVLFVFLFRAFGGEAAAIGLTVWSLVPFSFDYLAGSLLRWDWLFAVGMAFVLWRRARPFAAGGFLGYAIASKLFPVAFAVALGLWLLVDSIRHRRLHPHLPRLVAGIAAVALVLAAAATALFGPSVWRGYRDRMAVTMAEKYYPNQYSLKTVFLQAAESQTGDLWGDLVSPKVIKQSLPEVDLAAHQPAFLVAQLLLTCLVLVAAARAGPIEAMAAGPFLVFIWLTVNAYYWNMLGLSALAWGARRGGLSWALVGLHATLAAFYLHQHLNRGFAEGAFVALLLLGVLVLWAVQTLLSPRDADRS